MVEFWALVKKKKSIQPITCRWSPRGWLKFVKVQIQLSGHSPRPHLWAPPLIFRFTTNVFYSFIPFKTILVHYWANTTTNRNKHFTFFFLTRIRFSILLLFLVRIPYYNLVIQPCKIPLTKGGNHSVSYVNIFQVDVRHKSVVSTLLIRRMKKFSTLL